MLKCVYLSKLAYIMTVLILSVSLSMFIVVTVADNASFTVQPQEEHVITLNLKETDSVSGSFSVVSDDESGVNFYVTDPAGNTILRHDNVGQRSFSFTAQATGDFKLHFDNSVSSVYSKKVVLDYNITHYIMGMPQEQFLLLVIFAVALIGIIAYAILMPK